MKETIIIVAIILFAVVFIYLCVKSVRKNYQKLSHPSNFASGPEPIKRERAKIVDKQTVMKRFRPDIITPDHRICYVVTFEMEDGTQQAFEVDEAAYNRFSVSQAGALLTRDKHVIDFVEDDFKGRPNSL